MRYFSTWPLFLPATSDHHQQQQPEPGQTHVWLCSASFPGLDLESRGFSSLPVPASCNQPNRQNTVHIQTLLPLIPLSGRDKLLAQIASKPIYAILGWRLSPNPFPVFQTRHLVITEVGDMNENGVVFSNDLAWARAIAKNHEIFMEKAQKEEAAAAAAAQTTSTTPEQAHHHQQYSRRLARYHQLHHRRQTYRRTLCERRALQHFHLQSGADEKRQYHSRRLIETLRRYAGLVFAETGDTAELLRAAQLAHRMSECRLQQDRGQGQGQGQGEGQGKRPAEAPNGPDGNE